VLPDRSGLTDTHRERISILTFYGIVLLLGYMLYQIFEPFLMPLAWAAVLAIFVFPWHGKYAMRYGRTGAAAISTAIVSALIVIPGLMVLTAFVRETTSALREMDRDALAGPLAWLEQRWYLLQRGIPGASGVDLGTLVDQITQRSAEFVATRAGGLVADLAEFVFKLFVMLFALFFFLRDASSIVAGMRRMLPFDERRRERMIRQTEDLVHASIVSGVIIATLQGGLGGLLFWVLGIGAPVFWGVVMGFFSFLPFFGTWVVWLPAGIWLLMSDHITRGILMLVLGGTVVASVDNFVRPAILSGRARMNGLLMFISLLGGMSLFGLIGVVLGPLVIALAAGLLEAYTAPIESIGSEL
jgi:predicted PurR-regulated permease PerM